MNLIKKLIEVKKTREKLIKDNYHLSLPWSKVKRSILYNYKQQNKTNYGN